MTRLKDVFIAAVALCGFSLLGNVPQPLLLVIAIVLFLVTLKELRSLRKSDSESNPD